MRFFHRFRQYRKGYSPLVAQIKVTFLLDREETLALRLDLGPMYIRRRTLNGKF